MKLPKQWKYWCKKMRLKVRRGRFSDHYLTGRGCYWRVNCYGQLQKSEPFEAFDRWANSVSASTNLPKTHAEFIAAIKELESK